MSDQELPDSAVDEICEIQVVLTMPFKDMVVLQQRLMQCACRTCSRLAYEMTKQMSAAACEAALSPMASSAIDQAMANNVEICRLVMEDAG